MIQILNKDYDFLAWALRIFCRNPSDSTWMVASITQIQTSLNFFLNQMLTEIFAFLFIVSMLSCCGFTSSTIS
jgi:hypothetical protein